MSLPWKLSTLGPAGRLACCAVHEPEASTFAAADLCHLGLGFQVNVSLPKSWRLHCTLAARGVRIVFGVTKGLANQVCNISELAAYAPAICCGNSLLRCCQPQQPKLDKPKTILGTSGSQCAVKRPSCGQSNIHIRQPGGRGKAPSTRLCGLAC